MENTYHAGKELHGNMRHMDGPTDRKPDRPHAIRACCHSLPQAGRDIQTRKSHPDALQGRLQQELRHYKSDKHHSILGRGNAGLENLPAGKLPGMETRMLTMNHQSLKH